jgi:hypothetical protein
MPPRIKKEKKARLQVDDSKGDVHAISCNHITMTYQQFYTMLFLVLDIEAIKKIQKYAHINVKTLKQNIIHKSLEWIVRYKRNYDIEWFDNIPRQEGKQPKELSINPRLFFQRVLDNEDFNINHIRRWDNPYQVSPYKKKRAAGCIGGWSKAWGGLTENLQHITYSITEYLWARHADKQHEVVFENKRKALEADIEQAIAEEEAKGNADYEHIGDDMAYGNGPESKEVTDERARMERMRTCSICCEYTPFDERAHCDLVLNAQHSRNGAIAMYNMSFNSHYMCKKCFNRTFYDGCITGPEKKTFKCMFEGRRDGDGNVLVCPGEFSQIKHYLTKQNNEYYNRWTNEAILNTMMDMSEFERDVIITCANLSCGKVLAIPLSRARDKCVTCECNSTYCIVCRKMARPGDMRHQCNVTQAINDWDALLKSVPEGSEVKGQEAYIGEGSVPDADSNAPRVRPCPHCAVPITKRGGCNHITCKACWHTFCWQCGIDYCQPYHCNNRPSVGSELVPMWGATQFLNYLRTHGSVLPHRPLPVGQRR